MSEENVKKIGYKDVLRQKEYMKLILASLVNRFGDSIDAIAFTWLVYQLTENAAYSALMFGINKLPTIFLTPFTGAWVESRNKKWIMVWTDLGRALCVAFIATGYMLGFLNAGMLFGATLLISTLEAFRVPAGTALTPKLLEKQYYEYGMSLNSTAGSLMEIIGMAMAGGVIALIGISGAVYLDMATFIFSAVVIMFIHSKEEKREKQASMRGAVGEYVHSLTDGMKYVKKSHAILFFTAVCIVLNAFLTPLNSLMAPLAEEVLNAEAVMVSILSTGATVGMLIGSVTYPLLRKWLSARLTFALPGFGIGAYYIGLVACRPLYDNVIFTYIYVALTTGLLGCFASWMISFMNVELVKKIDEEYLARSIGVVSAMQVASMPVMSFLISAVIGLTGTANIFLWTGIIAFVVCAIMVRSKELDEEPVTEEMAAGEAV